ncbi:MAG: metal-dependent transcriptional regulator [Gemmatimonadales bacterium]
MVATVYREPLTRSVEDYLKAIYSITIEGAAALTKDLAGRLELSPASVSGMVKRLAEQGLIVYTPYKGAELTRNGRQIALRMLRRHRVIETYLVEFLGYDWDTVHDEAERMEHAVSDDLIERMADRLGDPRFDPHGDPIPASDGTVAEVIYVPLPDLKPGRPATVRRVHSEKADELRYLALHGLKPGARVILRDRQPFQGPLTLEVDGTEQIIGHEIGSLVLCGSSDKEPGGGSKGRTPPGKVRHV